MSVTLKDDNTTVNFYLCSLLCVPCMITTSSVICASMHLYKITVCEDGVVVYMCLCMLFVTCVAIVFL